MPQPVDSPLSTRRGFAMFASLGFAANVAAMEVNLFRAHFAYFAPHAPDRAYMIPLIAPLFVLCGMTTPTAVGALCAKAACSAFGRLPALSLLLILPACAFVMWLQMIILLPVDWAESTDKFGMLERCLMAQLPMLLVFWIWARKPIQRSPVAAPDDDDVGWHPTDPA